MAEGLHSASKISHALTLKLHDCRASYNVNRDIVIVIHEMVSRSFRAQRTNRANLRHWSEEEEGERNSLLLLNTESLDILHI